MTYLKREDLERREEAMLAPYAALCSRSRGREVAENPDWLRTEYQRDRDRILHCSAFRNLESKTQVYVTNEGDNFRTRLTHTFEVAQIARTLACNLGVNRDLTEAIALAHDLGHTPFGHAGERVLTRLMADNGGFEHNAQSLRVVEVLEDRFFDRPGLNLTWEVREGIAHHSKARHVAAVNRYQESPHPSLEGQLVDVADEIAYNHHDLDDAMRMGLLEPGQLAGVAWVWEIWELAQRQVPEGADPGHLKNRFLGILMDRMVHDMVENVSRRLDEEPIESIAQIRERSNPLGCFSSQMQTDQKELQAFLMTHVYRHPITLQMQSSAVRCLTGLFDYYRDQPGRLPSAHRERMAQWGLERVLADYLSSLTDRQCLMEYCQKIE